MGVMTQLCHKGIYLREGKVVEASNIDDVFSLYVMAGNPYVSSVNFPKREDGTVFNSLDIGCISSLRYPARQDSM